MTWWIICRSTTAVKCHTLDDATTWLLSGGWGYVCRPTGYPPLASSHVAEWRPVKYRNVGICVNSVTLLNHNRFYYNMKVLFVI